MGGSHSREELESSDFEEEQNEDEQTQQEEDDKTYEDVEDEQRSSERRKPKTPLFMDEVEGKLKALKLKYPSTSNPNLKNTIKLYLHVSGNTPKSRWIVSNNIAAISFVKMSQIDEDDKDNDEESGDLWWVLKVGSKVKAKVGTDLQLKSFGDQRRVDFVC